MQELTINLRQVLKNLGQLVEQTVQALKSC